MEPSGTTLFCDDIRSEQQGKLSLIGCYGAELIVFSALPVILPKFGIFIQLRFPRGFQSQIKLLIYLPGDEKTAAIVHDVPFQSPPEPFPEFSDPDIEPMLGINYPFLLSPLQINQLGYIKVRVSYDDEILRIGTLKISSMPAVAATPESPQT